MCDDLETDVKPHGGGDVHHIPSHYQALELVVFDVRTSGAIESLLSARSAWGEDAAIELLGPEHAVPVVRAGGAARIAERRMA